MGIQRFENIIAWQKAQDFALIIYTQFETISDYGFKNQLRRAVVSISNNIAEGFDRQSNKEFIRFLYIAMGSCSEVKSMLYLATKLKYINEKDKDWMILQADEIAKIIRGLIHSMEH